MKSVHILTGIRSEYDILAPVLDAMDATGELETGVIVTGAHLSSAFGNSVSQIERDGRRIVARIDSLLASDGLAGRVKGAALQLAGITDLFARDKPDFLVVMGDREESMTGALAAAYHHVPLVHIGGGDHADDGNVDNSIRHAVSKLAHLHMVTTPLSARRVEALGEESWRVHVVGASGIDRFAAVPRLERDALEGELGVEWGGEPFAVLLYHPTVTDFSRARENAATITAALERSGLHVAIIAPNSDPGNLAIVEEIEAFVARYPRARAFRFLERTVFVNLLRHARVLVGNSSAGLIEAPTIGLPVVNVGVRQRGREHGENVIFVDYDPAEIDAAIGRATGDAAFRSTVENGSTPYGDGTAGKRIADILSRTEVGEKLMHKRFVLQDETE